MSINYSTAKTIIQTFRRDKRISKQPNTLLETKKSIKHENFIGRFLNPHKVGLLLSAIIDTEKRPKPPIKFMPELDIEISPLLNASSNEENTPRIIEINKFPKKVDCGVTANLGLKEIKKDIFFLDNRKNAEDEYLGQIDYNDNIYLRGRTKGKSLKNTPKLLELNTAITKNVNLTFDFREYKEDIIKPKKHTNTISILSERKLPSPNFEIFVTKSEFAPSHKATLDPDNGINYSC